MSTAEDNVIYAENVALVQSHDVNSLKPPILLEKDFLDFTGDVNETIELEVVESQVIEETLESHIEKLFGCWIANYGKVLAHRTFWRAGACTA